MSTLTTDQNLEIPSGSDVNGVPGDFVAYNAGVESRLVKRYASAADRAVRNASPNEGEMSYLLDTGTYETFDGSAWVALIFGSAVSVQSATTDLPTTTSLTYTSIGNQTGHAFVAPPSGKTLIMWTSAIENSAAAGVTLCAPEVRTGAVVGSGTAVLTATDDVSQAGEWDAAARSTRNGCHHMLTGLTPGSSYNVRLLSKVTAGTGTNGRRTVTTVPVV